MSSDFELIPEPPYQYANQDLWDSIEYNSKKGIELALKDGANINYQQNELTPLLRVIEKNNFEFVKLLVENGADYNARDQDGNSCLMKAIENNFTNIAKFLLEIGAKPYGRNKSGITPLQLAFEKGNYEIMNILLEKDIPIDADMIQLALQKENFELLRVLLEKDIQIGVDFKIGMDTLLTYAIRENDTELAKVLIERGYDLNTPDDNWKETPLIWAIKRLNVEIVKSLLKYKEKINLKAKTAYGLNLLECARATKNKEIEDLIQEAMK